VLVRIFWVATMTETGLSIDTNVIHANTTTSDAEPAIVDTIASFDSVVMEEQEGDDKFGVMINHVNNSQPIASEQKLINVEAAVLPFTTNECPVARNTTTKPWIVTLSRRPILARWPRTKAVLGRICLLWTLILWALFLGYILSLLEGPAEIKTNDEILQQRWFFSTLPWQEVFVAGVNLPTACMQNFIDANALGEAITNVSTTGSSSSTTSLSLMETLVWNITNIDNATLMLVHDIMQDRFPNITLPPVPVVSNDTSSSDMLESLQLYLEKCDDVAVDLMEIVINTTLKLAEDELGITPDTIDIGDPLTFNWIRCWDNSILGNPNPWSPTQAQINASASQGLFYREEWTTSQRRLFENYTVEWECFDLSDAITRDKCILDAVIDSVKNATGGDQCETNTGGTSLQSAFISQQGRFPYILMRSYILVPLLSFSSFWLVLVYCDDDGRVWQSVPCNQGRPSLGCRLGLAQYNCLWRDHNLLF
jgi:hypothetical protein